MLNSKNFTTALEIISKHHSTELAFADSDLGMYITYMETLA